MLQQFKKGMLMTNNAECVSVAPAYSLLPGESDRVFEAFRAIWPSDSAATLRLPPPGSAPRPPRITACAINWLACVIRPAVKTGSQNAGNPQNPLADQSMKVSNKEADTEHPRLAWYLLSKIGFFKTGYQKGTKSIKRSQKVLSGPLTGPPVGVLWRMFYLAPAP